MDRYSKSIIWASWIFRAGLLVWTFDPLIENISKGNELLIEVWSNLSFGLLVVSALFELVMLIINHKRFIKALENSKPTGYNMAIIDIIGIIVALIFQSSFWNFWAFMLVCDTVGIGIDAKKQKKQQDAVG